jgi:hypothetical protein
MVSSSAAIEIAVAALLLSSIGLALPFIIYICARPRLTLEVAHAEVVSVRVSDPSPGGAVTVTMTNLDIVVRNSGHRTALVDDWTIVRHLGTERQRHWDVASTDDLPRSFGIRARDAKRLAAALYSPDIVNVSAKEAWSDIDMLVTYRPFFFWRPQTVSRHFALAP